MKNSRLSRRVLLGTTAVALLALPVSLASANADALLGKSRHSVVAFGAYNGAVDGVRAPFDGGISNNSMAVSPDEKIAVATNSQVGRLVVLDLRSGRRIAEIKGYVTPRSILFSPDGKDFLVSDSTLGVVDRISRKTFRVTERLPLGAGVFGTAQTRDGGRLYANNQAADTLTVVDLANGRPEHVVTGFSEPRQGVQLSPAGDKLYVTNFDGGRDGRITVLDTRPDRPEETPVKLKEITGFNQVRGLSISRDGTRLYAANSGDHTVSIVDTGSGDTLAKVPVGQSPYGAALSPDETVLLSGNLKGNSLTAVEPGSGDVIGTVTGVKGPRQAISFSADSRTAWVLNEDLTVAQVDVRALKVTRTLG
ncbi:YncE family protein [Streptomyces pactum]|uniref:YncE family protein n=1 Tax=Streptomyces pactum TaxID=68249 RepID=UPI0036F93E28